MCVSGCSSETEPSLEVVTRLIDYVRDNNIPVVFHLEMSNGKIAQLIGDDTELKFCSFRRAIILQKMNLITEKIIFLL